MVHQTMSVRPTPLQSARSMTLSAMAVECEWFIYLFVCTLCLLIDLLCVNIYSGVLCMYARMYVCVTSFHIFLLHSFWPKKECWIYKMMYVHVFYKSVLQIRQLGVSEHEHTLNCLWAITWLENLFDQSNDLLYVPTYWYNRGKPSSFSSYVMEFLAAFQ